MEPENHPFEEDIDASSKSSFLGSIFLRQCKCIFLGTNTRDPIWRAYFSNGIHFGRDTYGIIAIPKMLLAGKHVFFYNMGLLLMSPHICRYGRAKIPLHSAQKVD